MTCFFLLLHLTISMSYVLILSFYHVLSFPYIKVTETQMVPLSCKFTYM